LLSSGDYPLEPVPEELVVNLVMLLGFRGFHVGTGMDEVPRLAQLRRPILCSVLAPYCWLVLSHGFASDRLRDAIDRLQNT
jgi:hypothetical protein